MLYVVILEHRNPNFSGELLPQTHSFLANEVGNFRTGHNNKYIFRSEKTLNKDMICKKFRMQFPDIMMKLGSVSLKIV